MYPLEHDDVLVYHEQEFLERFLYYNIFESVCYYKCTSEGSRQEERTLEVKSRTEYSARNTTVAMVARVIAILAGYLTRVVFTHTLSEDYAGINGLFTDILNVLALSELGVETAITYALYGPISEGDIEKQKSLMRLYRKIYRIVACVVLVLGLLIIPFLGVLIRDQPQVEHLIFIYLMYLFNSVVSYLLIYRRTLVDAHQLSYIGVLYQTGFLIFQNLVQIAILYFTGNFILFLAVLNLCTIGSNVAISARAVKMYPYLKDKNVQKLSVGEKRGIYQNIRAMLMHKVGNVMVNNTDNLLLSALVGTLSVGCYSNYFLVIGSVNQVLKQVFQGITASVGNLGVEEGRERIKKIFEASFFIGQWMFGLAAICLYVALDPFVELSFGPQYVFSREITLILCLNFYLTGMRQAALVFRDSMGVFRFDRYKAIPEAVINIVVSLVLGRMMGTAGIFLGTMVSTVTTSLWVEPYMLYRHRLQASSKPYFLRYFLYAAVTFLLWWGEELLCRQIVGGLLWTCLLRLVLCFVITNVVYFLLYHRTREFRLLWQKALIMVKNRNSKTASEKGISAEENYLFGIINDQLNMKSTGLEREKKVTFCGESIDEPDWIKICDIAERHSVLPLLYGELAETETIPESVRSRVATAARRTVKQSYHILFLGKFVIARLEEAGIKVALLKGVGTASYYPVPELRKSGDVDLLLITPDCMEEAKEILLRCGFRVSKEQHALHHLVFTTGEGIEIELHTMLAEPFDNQEINRYMQEKLPDCSRNVRRVNCMGVELPILDTGYHGYELLLHMLQHFLWAGFGLRLLCDWVVFWNRETEAEERKKYLGLVRESGVKGFSDIVTLICCTYLGLNQERIAWMEITEKYDLEIVLREIMEAEEFGNSAAERMVTLRENSLGAYVREFQHQMHLNFPRAGRYFPLWPGLWLVTLVRFLRNNRKVRGVSARAVLKKAGQRSRVMEQIKLWK